MVTYEFPISQERIQNCLDRKDKTTLAESVYLFFEKYKKLYCGGKNYNIKVTDSLYISTINDIANYVCSQYDGTTPLVNMMDVLWKRFLIENVEKETGFSHKEYDLYQEVVNISLTENIPICIGMAYKFAELLGESTYMIKKVINEAEILLKPVSYDFLDDKGII